jgi:glycogen debranching enzyme
MYMSKNWMTKTWSWDHCFNAIALTASPTLALDQFLTLFDHQDAYGALPDCIDDATISFNFAKPPVHGWTWRKMTQRMAVDASQTLDVYRRLSRLADWWLLHRTTDAGLPHYRHGNDSGWDNGTAFRRVVPVESPDLCAFLVIQMDVLADLADDLGLGRESIDWRTKADRLLTQMTTRLWVDGRFVARGVIDQEPIPSHSLMMYVPLVLGERLPDDIFRALSDGLLADGFLTPHGLATESVESEDYTSDGYWRGPIWAPSTYLIHEGLADSGRPDLAETIARRFCDTIADAGMAENFDALTGQGLRDRAYTWTSSVFLLLAEDLARLDAAEGSS